MTGRTCPADDAGPQDLSSGLPDSVRRVAFQRIAEGIVDRHQVPAVGTRLGDRRADRVGLPPGIVGPVDGVRGGPQSLPVRSEVPPPETSMTLLACSAMAFIARATAEFGTSTMTSTPS